MDRYELDEEDMLKFYNFKVDMRVSKLEELCVSNFDDPIDVNPFRIKILNLSVTCEEDTIANLELYLIPDGLDDEDANEYVMTGDDNSADMYNELFPLITHKFYQKDAFSDYDCNPIYPTVLNVYSGSIHTLYVSPDERRKHVAKFLLNNLNIILEHYADINVRCLTTYVNPYHNDKPGHYASTCQEGESSEDVVMRKNILKFLKNMGFKKVRGYDNTYIVDLFENMDIQ